MEIIDLVQRFTIDSQHILEIYIGKNLNRNLFTVNNKIFFDILLQYIQKNGWYTVSQSVIKTYSTPSMVLESKVENKPSSYLDYSIPTTTTYSAYKKDQSNTKKYKGTYYDLLCSNYHKNPILVQEFQQDMDQVYNETVQEVTIFEKKNTSCSIHFVVEKENNNQFYSIKVVFDRSIENLDHIIELFEIIDLAMSRYKKTDKTISSRFDLIPTK